MKAMRRYLGGMGMMLAMSASVMGGQAMTQVSASHGNRSGDGVASAMANYEGQGGQGIARTRTETGDINLARALAVGVDRNGMDISFSHAIAGPFGILPAYAGTFNLSIGRDGSVAGSYGGALASGGLVRSAEAGGVTSSGPHGSTAQATAGGSATPGGSVRARTDSYSRPSLRSLPRQPVTVIRRAR
ncbi:MAG: hypothetical protein GXY55_12030 [Phycisphaerae bacterium]|nr:hypothetical protein [Phycisphaerae bacterium]